MAEAPVRQFDPKDVSIHMGGMIITGVAEGTFVTCEKNEDNYQAYVGSQGEVARTHNADPTGTITFTLEHTSPSNSHMLSLANSKDMFAGKVTDMNADGGESVGGSDCWCVKPANLERAGEVTDREWTVYVADYEIL